jgi:hypothetical protein
MSPVLSEDSAWREALPRVDMRARTVVRSFAVLILLVIAAGMAAGPATAASATITYRKVFKSSFPEFVEIKLDETGAGTYDIRQLTDEASPETLQVGAPLARRIFDLAEKLHNFDGVSLESRHRIANLGEKTFRYDRGTESHAVTFNYTVDDSADQLVDAFEGIARQLSDASDLQHALRFDRLGVNDALLQIEKDFDAKLLPEPERLLPLLGQVSADDHVIDMARRRATDLAARIQPPAR